jgi:hypothetical protein
MTSVTMYLITAGAITFCGVPVDDAPPWVAMPYRDFGLVWECGDVIAIDDGDTVRTFLALDAGPFGAHCVVQPSGECLSIAADVPELHWWCDGLSTTGRVWNVTELQREWTQRAGS